MMIRTYIKRLHRNLNRSWVNREVATDVQQPNIAHQPFLPRCYFLMNSLVFNVLVSCLLYVWFGYKRCQINQMVYIFTGFFLTWRKSRRFFLVNIILPDFQLHAIARLKCLRSAIYHTPSKFFPVRPELCLFFNTSSSLSDLSKFPILPFFLIWCLHLWGTILIIWCYPCPLNKGVYLFFIYIVVFYKF